MPRVPKDVIDKLVVEMSKEKKKRQDAFINKLAKALAKAIVNEYEKRDRHGNN